MIYYVIFATIVATVKTIYYLEYEIKEHMRKSSTAQILAAYVLTWFVCFWLAPVVVIEETYKFYKNRRRKA